MKAASINELKTELKHLETDELVALCLRLAKYKKENKELLDYMLFEASDERGYVQKIQEVITEQFAEIPKGYNLYYAKKTIRKILRIANKYIKYSGQKTTEVEVRIFFLQTLKDSKIKIQDSTALTNLYLQQLKKINTVIKTLHEDLQYDFEQELKELEG